jgi:hypothetical protein
VGPVACGWVVNGWGLGTDCWFCSGRTGGWFQYLPEWAEGCISFVALSVGIARANDEESSFIKTK